MTKTLLVLGTHFIDENVISEYRKMKNTPGIDAVLAIDNTNAKIDFKNRVEDKFFYDTSVKCFFIDSTLHEEFELPHFLENGEINFKKNMYENGDYRFYYFRKNFSDYDYYWMIDYDVFLNAETYAGFLKKFDDNSADLLIQALQQTKKSDEGFLKNLDWFYNDEDKIYQGIFAVVRLSARAIDFLYRKRVEQGAVFRASDYKNKQWVFCEVFVPTTLIHGGFICENLNEKRVRFLPHIYLNDERIFLNPDNHLYHPVKSVKSEIEKLKNLYAELFFNFRKNFLIHFYEKLTSISTINLKDLPVEFDENFNSMAINLSAKTGGGSLRCETWFLSEKLYGAVSKIYSAVVFEGEYLERFKTIEQYINLDRMTFIKIFENSTCKMLTYDAPTFDNVSQVANVTKVLIEMTFTVLREKINENNRQ